MVLKNKKLLLGILLLIGVVFLFLGNTIFASKKEKTSEKQISGKEKTNEINNLETSKNISDPEQPMNNSKTNTTAISEVDQIRNMFPDSAFLTLVSLDQAPLSPQKKMELADKIKNLYKYGSLSGGKITHEFSNLEQHRNFLTKYGYDTIKEKISFSPKDIPLNNSSLQLTGSYYSGGYTQNSGFDSLYRLYESPNGEKIEVNQTKLSKDGMKLLIIEETLNYRFNKIPATLETFDSDMTYNLRFIHDGYRYAISTKNSDKDYIIDIANSLTKQ